MKFLIIFELLALGILAVSCKQEEKAPEKPYVYDLRTVNVGQADVSGLSMNFGSYVEHVGGLDGNSKYEHTHVLFETPVPYPSRIEYYPRNATSAADVIVITDIKVNGELKRDLPNQALLVQVDTTSRKAVCTVELRSSPKP